MALSLHDMYGYRIKNMTSHKVPEKEIDYLGYGTPSENHTTVFGLKEKKATFTF